MADADPFAGLKRLGTDALGPCIMCDRLMLQTFPLFYRAKIQRCGIDRVEVTRHVGLAATLTPKSPSDGLALAALMGPTPQPVVVTDDFETVNVCVDCAGRTPFETVMLTAMAKQEDKDG